MSSLDRIKAAKTLNDVAGQLGFKPESLAYILYKIPDTLKYSEFSIKKRKGGVREIKAPEKRLKLLQRRLANLLYRCLEEIDGNSVNRKSLSHGFMKKKSIITNASQHKCRRYVLNVDLKDFFPSINFGRVRGVFIKDRRFQFSEKTSTIIAQIACHEHTLPQGSPCSPVISNIVAHLLDINLVKLAKKYRCTYSRYADDITFSTNQEMFPIELAELADGADGEWKAGKALLTEIQRSGFEINHAKTRLQVRGSRQVATGLLVNKKVNVRPEYYRTVRSMCHSLFNNGEYYRLLPAALEGGDVDDPDIKVTVKSMAPLQGMLEHIYHVRNSVDLRESAIKKKDSTATRRLYHKFLFFKNFVALEKPLVITEGKTDPIYLLSAIEMLKKYQPEFGEFENSIFKPNIKFLNFTKSVHDVLQLGGGTGDFKFFILSYRDLMKKYGFCPLAHPVILLIDNDDGANAIFSVLKEMKINISHASNEPFYKITDNLYLVKTPESNKANKWSSIEDFFHPDVRAIELGGKRFDPSNKQNGEKTYGKAFFAEKVVRPQRKNIDFSEFSLIIDRIKKAKDDYYSSKSV